MKNSSKLSKAETNGFDQSQTVSFDKQSSQLEEIFNQIIELNQVRAEYEKEHLLDEAGKVFEELKKLENEFKKNSLKVIQQRQIMEFQQLEDQYQQELNQADELWSERLSQTEGNFQTSFSNLDQVHDEQQQSLDEYLCKKLSNLRKNKEIINMEYQMNQLIKEKRYQEAQNIKKRLIQKEEELSKKQEKEVRLQKQNHFINLAKKQDIERQSFEQKFKSLQNEFYSQREKDFEAIHSKYNVFRDKLRVNHKQELINKKKELQSFNATSNALLQKF